MPLINPYDAKKRSDKLLEDWDDVCIELNIPHFLVLGTCLGFHRDKGYIESDTDLDVGVLCDPQKVKELAAGLLKKGIRDGGRLAVNINFGRESILLDVWHKFGPLHQAFLKKFDTIEYEGRTYNTPSPIEDYLEFLYVDWKTPTTAEKKENGVWIGKAQPSACDYTDKGPVLL